MDIILTENQKKELELQHKKERDSKVSDRIKAVLLSNEGWSQSQIAQALRINEGTVYVHLQDYVQNNKLSNNSGGSQSKLTKEQSKELTLYVESTICPSTREIITHVFEKYCITYTQQGMYDWLKSHEFSYKHPKGIPLKHDKEAQEKFKKEYEALKANRKANEKIMFIDSVHPTQATKITSGWIRKGIEKIIPTIAGRNRINLTGAIDLESMSILVKEYKTINGESTVDFLKYIDSSTKETDFIHLIADSGRAHTCIEVGAYLGLKDPFNRKYLKEKCHINLPSWKTKINGKIRKKLKLLFLKEPDLFSEAINFNQKELTAQNILDSMSTPQPHKKFILHILPAYSPNLNPIERVWKYMNEHVRNNKVFPTFKKFYDAIINFFKDEWETFSVDELRIRINDNFETFGLRI